MLKWHFLLNTCYGLCCSNIISLNKIFSVKKRVKAKTVKYFILFFFLAEVKYFILKKNPLNILHFLFLSHSWHFISFSPHLLTFSFLLSPSLSYLAHKATTVSFLPISHPCPPTDWRHWPTPTTIIIDTTNLIIFALTF